MVTFDFGEGKTRVFSFTLMALRRFKQSYGKSLWRVRLVDRARGEFQPELAMDHGCITHAVWAALLHGEPNLTLLKTEELMQDYITSGGDITKIGDALGQAFEESGLFGKRKKEPDPAAESDPNENRDPLN